MGTQLEATTQHITEQLTAIGFCCKQTNEQTCTTVINNLTCTWSNTLLSLLLGTGNRKIERRGIPEEGLVLTVAAAARPR